VAGSGLDQRIDVDLSVCGLSPPLHLPVLAGLAQGPGFPNLSCLGLLSDRVLRRYAPSGPPDRIDRERRAHDRSAR
jgi:mycobactin lysine-N-oxygenase